MDAQSSSSSSAMETPREAVPESARRYDGGGARPQGFLLWFAASLLLGLAGCWGAIGGWYFGLPIGGETREDVFGDKRLSLRDLLVTIPHPDLADVPFEAGPRGVQVREKFRDKLGSKQGVINVAPARGPQPEQQKSAKSDAAGLNQSQTAPPYEFAPLSLPYFTTRIDSLQMALQLDSPLLNGRICLVFLEIDQGAGACVPLPHDMPANQPANLKVPDASIRPPPLQAIGSVFPEQGRASQLQLARYAREPVDPMAMVYSVSLGNAAGTPPAGDTPTVWVSGILGDIFRISADPSGALSVTRLNVAGAGAITFVGFVSSDRGWAWATQGPERGITSHAAFQTFDGGRSWQALPYRWLPAPWVFVAFVLAAIAFERGTTARLKLMPVVADKYIADHGVSDDPIGLKDEDALGLMPIARSMARFLRNTETRPTVTIAVTGPWGCGKTSLMNLVKEDLNAHDVRTVWFNAWHNQKEENLLAALLQAVRSQAVPSLWTVSGFIYRLRVAWKRIGADPSATIAMLVFAAFALVILATHLDMAVRVLALLADRIAALLGSTEPAAPASPAAAAAPGAASAVASIGLSTGGVTALVFAGKKLWELFKPIKSIPAELLSTLSGDAGTKEIDQQLSFRYRFASEFAIFCDTLRRPPHPGLVIFVDDLDRCAPKQTVDILEAINFVTSAGRCFVVLGLDESRVRAAIADTYKDMTLQLDTGPPTQGPEPTPSESQRRRLALLNDFAGHYLEKLIHLVVPVPRSRQETVERLLGLTPATAKQQQAEPWRPLVKTMFETLGTVLVVSFLIASAWLGLALATSSLPTVAASSAAPSNPPGPATPADPPPPTRVASPAETLRPALTGPAITATELSAGGLTTRSVLDTVPPAAFVAAFALLLTIMSFQFLPRLQIEPVVSDSPQFQQALRIWLEGITRTRDTPRAVKRFVNRLRFMAMRLRDLSTEAQKAGQGPPFDEAALVAMAVTGDVSEDLLGMKDDELRIRTKAGGAQKSDAVLVLSSLEKFRAQFGRDPYANAVALPTFRLLAGLVAEASGEGASGPK